ncbi:hypothetical protein AXF42_Ash020089 [Apostasia shenzhenica]|uniref:DUF2232 domain-containing protein n=1 Tax=Apostasia shenzhenica TaxID=1088818 RepID=A0A2I0APU6_9ASPA|nr:hypothetical protein AXF42_Ash020089 [Apostasia shenzhenica]
MSLVNLIQLADVPGASRVSRTLSSSLLIKPNSQILLSLSKPARDLRSSSYASSPNLSISCIKLFQARVSVGRAEAHVKRMEEKEEDEKPDDLSAQGEVFNKTLRLVECSMLASLAGLAYFLSNSLSIENYLGCFFSLPIVISSIRWGVAAGRKTMIATTMLLFTLSGPVKACTYLLMHGLVGLAMGSLWRLRVNWGLSLALCTLVRVFGVVGYVLLTSFLIRENILNLITINVHVSLSYVLTAIGVNIIPSMGAVYAIFGFLLLLNCGFFVLLLHILYTVLLAKLGMKACLALPSWLEKAI